MTIWNTSLACGYLAIVLMGGSALLSLNPLTRPGTVRALGGPLITNVAAPDQVARYDRYEISFDVINTSAGNYQLPYDPALPPGLDPDIDGHRGISVDAIFTPDNWHTQYRQPAFFYREYLDGGLKPSWDGHEHEWYYPTDRTYWKVRFAPNRPGAWKFKLMAVDARGSCESPVYSLTVNSSTNNGFVRVSKVDPRYFEFDSGALFLTPGLQAAGQQYDPMKGYQRDFTEFQKNGIRLLRYSISDLYGAAWPRWVGNRNIYDGYLPRPGLLPVYTAAWHRAVMSVSVTYPERWFDACRYEFWDDAEAVRPGTYYKFSIRYQARYIAGPRHAGNPHYGLVGKISESGASKCHESGNGMVVTGYGGNTATWQTIEGIWFSGQRNFLPKVSVGLENVSAGEANILSISLREIFGKGRYGPEILQQPSMEYELYYPELAQYKMDKLLALAQKHDIYLKLVLMDKGDQVYSKLNGDGSFVLNGQPDDLHGFYGLGRKANKTRWLQQARWRYIQARWGYSPNIHSFELTNEGDPFLKKHWEMADEFGKFMHCRVFGVDIGDRGGDVCTYEHPDRHLVTTSFWHSFPGYSLRSKTGFWGSPEYRNVDYADVHAYVGSSPASASEKARMQTDAAFYHLWHSSYYRAWNFNFPVVRGEAGIDLPANPGRPDPALLNDVQGMWYHNYLWSSLNSGALYEIYWWASPHVYNGTAYDHRPAARAFYNFSSTLNLNNGLYRDLEAVVSERNLRVVGQKDLRNGNAHFWVQNLAFPKALKSASVEPSSGTIRIGGFAAGRKYKVQLWDTYKVAGQSTEAAPITAGLNGTIELRVGPVLTDLAVKISPSHLPSNAGNGRKR